MGKNPSEDSVNRAQKVLVLAYYFPPLGMGGTQRAAKFVKYLPDFGWEPLVVTVKDVAYYARDPSLLDEIPERHIYRTGSLDPQRLLALLGRSDPQKSAFPQAGRRGWLSWFFVPDSKVFWLPFAFWRCLRIMREESVRVLLTTSPPHSVHLLGVVLKRVKNVTWVADFRDGWAGGNFQSEPTPLHRWINGRLQRRVLRRADAVIGVSRRLVEHLEAASAVPTSEKFHWIPNGFDAADVRAAEVEPPDDPFTVTYCGAVSAMAPLGGFLVALTQLLYNHPELRATLRVRIVGVDLIGDLREQIQLLNLSGVVRWLGYQPHLAAVREILGAHLLVYPVGEEASCDFIPGKTFEYLASGRPILAIGPSVEGVELLKQAGRVTHVSHADLSGIEAAIVRAYEGFKAKGLPRADPGEFERFERRHLTLNLAAIFEDLLKDRG